MFFRFLICLIFIPLFTCSKLECKHEIYCNNVFLNRFLPLNQLDSKSIVDRPLKVIPEEILTALKILPANASNENLIEFLNKYTFEQGWELKKIDPLDWKPEPEIVSKVPDYLKEFTISVNSKWKELVRTFDLGSLCNSCYSSIPVPHPFVVAGGRFVEYYYWDSYWIIQGLLISDMLDTAKSMIKNLLYLVEEFGFVPNGGRIYYLNRSQPPMLCLIINMFYEKTGDYEFMASSLETLEKEYNFFMQYKSITIQGQDYRNHKVNFYFSETINPRPESYKEDIKTADSLDNDKKIFVYTALTSAAESGWDFSSRWLLEFKNLSSIQTQNIIPLDLNCIMFVNEVTLSNLFKATGQYNRSLFYETTSKIRKESIHQIFWNSSLNMWGDFNIISKSINSDFYVSNLFPLWSNAFHQSSYDAFQTLLNMWDSIMNVAGIPTSLIESNQQWDFPNAWPPLQQFLIDTLLKFNNSKSNSMATELANVWLNTNWCGWKSTLSQGGLFFEKYNSEKIGTPGIGGEYTVQSGFGWTNGIILKILSNFGSNLKVPECTIKK